MQRLRTPDWLTGLAGLALLASFAGSRLGSPGGVWLAITGLLGVAVVAVTAARDEPSLPVAFDVLTCWAAVVAVPVAVVRLAGDAGWGQILGALAVLAVLAASFWAVRKQDQPGLRPPPQTRAMPAPPAGAQPSA